MQSGGMGMWFTAAIGAAMMWTAIQFARGADPQRLSILRALTLAILVASLTGFVGGLISTCRFILADPDALAAPLPSLLQGFAESCANLVLGGAFTVLSWILVAVGVRRMPRDPA
jgi:hypothetical protein